MTPQWLTELTTVCAGWEVDTVDDEVALMCYAGSGLALFGMPNRTFKVSVTIGACGDKGFTQAFLSASEAVRELIRRGWRAE